MMNISKFKLIIFYLLTCLIILTSYKNPTQSDTADSSTLIIEADGFDQRLSDLHQQIETVATSLQQAEGLTRTAGLIDLQVAKYFAEYIAWELDHPDIMKEALSRPPEKPVRLFVSLPSYIQDQRHIAALHRAYEAACFHDLPVGFVTENTLMNSGITDDIKMIIIPDAQYVSARALAALRRAKQKGVQLVRLGRQSITHDEYGFKHADESVAFLEDIPTFDYASAPDLARQFETLIQPLADRLPVTVKDRESQSAFGVMRRYANLDGRPVLMLVNLNPDAIDVQLVNRQGKKVNGYDLLIQEKVKGNRTHLPVKGVRLIELDH